MTLQCHLRHEETLSSHVSRPLHFQLRSDRRRNARSSVDLTEVERFPNAFLLILHASFINVSSSECSQTESVSYGVVRYFDLWKTARINKNSDLSLRPRNFDKMQSVVTSAARYLILTN